MAGKKALVLSGGSVKGSFQAGAIKAVLESGFKPEIIYGISVGSLNGSFIANAAGMRLVQRAPGSMLTDQDWKDIGAELVNFWLQSIRKPEDVAIQRSTFTDVIQIAFNKFQGLSDTTPVNTKVDTILNLDFLKRSPAKMIVGTVDFVTGELLYKSPFDSDYMAYLKGSIAIPIAMPPIHSIQGEVLFDGGVRDVAPLGHAINEGAREVIGILCQSAKLSNASGHFSERRLMQLVERCQDIVVNQNVRNDVEWIEYINSIVTEANRKGIVLDALKGYEIIEKRIIQPDQELTIDITDFNAKDIADHINMGYAAGQKKMREQGGNV